MQSVGEVVFDAAFLVLVFFGGIRLLVRSRAGSPFRLLGLAFVLLGSGDLSTCTGVPCAMSE